MKHYVDGNNGSWSTTIAYDCINAEIDDSLAFVVTENHNLIQMANSKAYKDCNFDTAMNTLLGAQGSGEVIVPLDTKGEYYFSCSIGEHCSNQHNGHTHDRHHGRHLGGEGTMYAQKIFVLVGGDTLCKDFVPASDVTSAATARLGTGISSPIVILGASFVLMYRKIMS